jgi:hypothetical protein
MVSRLQGFSDPWLADYKGFLSMVSRLQGFPDLWLADYKGLLIHV